MILVPMILYRDPVKMSDAIRDMAAYTLLTDSIIQQIMMSSDPQLEKVRHY